MKRSIIGLVFGMMAVMAFAVPARKVTISHTQHDGTVLSLTLAGDEHMHYYLNTATGEAMRQGADGDYYVIPAADLAAQTAAAETRRAQANEQRIARLPRMRNAIQTTGGPQRAIGTYNNMRGTKKGLVILVNFTDVTFTTANAQTAFQNQFNQAGYSQNGHIGSVKDYFSAQSNGVFTVDFDVVGPVTVSQNMEYYGGNDASGNDENPAEMIKEAVILADPLVNYADYDWSGDGFVDQVFVVYAGYAEAQGGADETIWPHQWDLSSAGVGIQTLDGKKIKSYACTAELSGDSGSTMDGIGTACHEFSHCLGYPDLYDTNGSTNGSGFGMGYFDLMDAGSYNGPDYHGEVPCGYSAYERWMAGWITPTELTAAASIHDMPLITSTSNFGSAVSASALTPERSYIIYNPSDRNEYYILENRPNTGYFQYYAYLTTGKGLFITHVKYNATAWQTNKVNIYSTNQRFTFVPADGTRNNSSFTTDFYPAGATSFTELSGKEVTNISITSDGLISFDFMGGYADDGTRYSITLDACGGTVGTASWTQTSMGEAWTLPEPETTVAGWSGAGWATQPLTAYTPVEDVDLIDYGTGYAPAGNVTLYAVYIDDDAELCHSNPANFSVTLNAGTGTCATTTWTQGSGARSLSLPTPTIDAEGWSFAGWATASVAETTTAPTFAASPYKPTADATLYAVYKKTENGTGKISTAGEIASGDQLIIVIADDSAAYAVQQGSTNYVAFTEQDEYADNIIWTATASGSGFTLKSGSNYIYNNGTGTTLSTTATNSTIVWVFTALGDNVFKVSRTDVNGRYICWTGSKFGAYAKGNWDNQIEEERRLAAGDGALYIYKVGSRRIYNSNPLTTLTGDVNMDGSIDVSDISTLAEYIFGGTPAQFDEDAADANGDGNIDVSDISTIAEIIFGS